MNHDNHVVPRALEAAPPVLEDITPNDLVIYVPNTQISDDGQPDTFFMRGLRAAVEALGYGFVDWGEETQHHTEMWFYKRD